MYVYIVRTFCTYVCVYVSLTVRGMNSKDKEGDNTRAVIACKHKREVFLKKNVADVFSNKLVVNNLAGI